MRIAIVGNDLRCGALARVLVAEGNAVMVVPGPPGSAIAPQVSVSPLPPAEGPSWWQMRRRDDIVRVVSGLSPDLVVCLHVESSDAGVVDALRAAGRKRAFLVFGVSQAGAQLEVSKATGLAFARRAGLVVPESTVIPAAARGRGVGQWAARKPSVLKADGLAGGRGTILVPDASQLDEVLVGMPAGDIVLQELVTGHEVALSIMASSSGVELLDVNLEYKREREGDEGENTPGMGTIACSVPRMGRAHAILAALPEHLHELGYLGPLDVSFMIDSAGRAVFLEFTCRFGDPEMCTELLLLTEVTEALVANAQGQRGVPRRDDVSWAAGVVVHGSTASPHAEVDAAFDVMGCDDGVVGCAAAAGASAEVAIRHSYRLVAGLTGLTYRRDIGHDVAARIGRLEAVLG